jgi:hypothetical protein
MNADKLIHSGIRISAFVILAIAVGMCFETGYDGDGFHPEQRPAYTVQQAKVGQRERTQANESIHRTEREYAAEVRHVADLFSCPGLDSAQTDSLFVLGLGDQEHYLPSRLAADVWIVCKYPLPARFQPRP